MLQERKGQQLHLCPLQFDIVDRLIDPLLHAGRDGLDPFGGLMTVPYCAVKMGRRGVGVELNTRYFARRRRLRESRRGRGLGPRPVRPAQRGPGGPGRRPQAFSPKSPRPLPQQGGLQDSQGAGSRLNPSKGSACPSRAR